MSKGLMAAAALGAMLLAAPALADDNTVTVGLILPMTGPSASTGKQERAGAELYIKQHGDTVAGKKIKLDRQGRHRRGRRHQAPRARSWSPTITPSALMGFGLTPLALAAAPDRDRGQGAGDRHRRRDRDDHREVALYRAHLVHAAAGLRADGGLGAEERHQEGRHHRHRLRPGRRRREMVRRHLREGRRDDRAEDPRAAEEPGLRAVPAAGEGRQAGRGVRLRAVRLRRDLHEAVRRARPRQVGHQADRHRRRHRRRPARRHRRLRRSAP